MNKPVLLSLLLLAITFVTATEVSADQITVGGTNRTYIKYVPTNLGEKRPLLISMHGMNQDANYQRGMLNIESIADTAKFAVVFPEGLNRSWDISGTSDINFVLAVIDDMAKKHDIDKNRVYLSGFSMGGMFTYHAMNHIADRIAAFAPISGYPMGGQPFTSSRPVPIIHTHGTSDDVVDFGGVQRSIDGWIARNGCYPTPIVTERYRTNSVTRHEWGPGDDGAEVVLLELAGKGHWISNDGFYTGEEIWNFCKRYSLDSHLPKVSIKYPLTEGEFVTLGSGKVFNVFFETDATSDVSTIESVSYYIDNKFIGKVDQEPFRLEWKDVVKGKRQLKVVATDADGRTCARAMPFTIKTALNSLDLSAGFKSEGIIPTGWLSYDGLSLKVGERTGLTGSNRVLKFTGDERDFDYAMLISNAKGKEYSSYTAYADLRSRLALYLTPGTYQLTFKACSWSTPDFGNMYCKVLEAFTDEVIAETEVELNVGLNNDSEASFSGTTDVNLNFVLNDNTTAKIVFYAPDAKKSDALVGNIRLKKVSTDAIEDIEKTDAEVVKVTYYDMLGRSHNSPIQGIMIRRTDYSDGTATTEKIIR